jgi:hypothetical protein
LECGSSLPLFQLPPCQLLTPVTTAQLHPAFAFTAARSPPYTAIEAILRLHFSFYPLVRTLAVSGLLTSAFLCHTNAQQAPQKPAEKPIAKPSTPTEPPNPAQLELLETKFRFEANGNSRKEVHARVHINSELGVRQFARLNFDYNRSFQSVEIPLVRITHPSGGTADILPSAITDNPNPAVINAPAYQDVRVKSVRILGLEPGDNLEYRVITTTTRHPLAPDFWLDHSFDRTGVVSQEVFELDLPASRKIRLHTSPDAPQVETIESESRTDARVVYRWNCTSHSSPGSAAETASSEPQIVLTSYESWEGLAGRLRELLEPQGTPAADVSAKASELAQVAKLDPVSAPTLRAEAIYTFVSQKIRTIDLPLGSTGFKTRAPSEILSSGYGTPEDKYTLFAALANSYFGPARAGLLPAYILDPRDSLPQPSAFDHLLTMTGWPSISFWLDLNSEVAPYLVIPSVFRGKKAFVVGPAVTELWRLVDTGIPFPAVQKVVIDAALASDGKLTAKVKYTMRGDNELFLRVEFHQAPKEKWQELAQLLSLSDGFRGKVTSITASDPYATREPFTVEYELTQPKFVDWSKRPVRIPALLPQLGLPDPPPNPAPGTATAPIELGTPLEVETRMTLRLPPGTTIATPTGTSVQRDYATFTSRYSAKGLTVTASRHINFLLRQVPAERAADYNAFLRAVLTDQVQDFTLDREPLPAPATRPASSPAIPSPSGKP